MTGVSWNNATLAKEDAPVTLYLYKVIQGPSVPRLRQFARETFPNLVARYVEPGPMTAIVSDTFLTVPDSVPATKAALPAGEQADRCWEYTPRCFFRTRDGRTSTT